MRIKGQTFLLLIVIGLALAACGGNTSITIAAKGGVVPRAEFGIDDDTTASELRRFARGKTFFFWDTGHGNQIEYMGTDGKAYLWYPGNNGTNIGRWKISSIAIEEADIVAGFRRERPEAYEREKAMLNRPSICFLYGANSYNPVTGEIGSNGYRCGSALRDAVAYVDGDPFNLDSGNVPIRLPSRPQVQPADLIDEQGQ